MSEWDSHRRGHVVRAGLVDQPGLAERPSHDYIRHGTSVLFAALEVTNGECHRRGHGLLERGRPRLPDGELHLAMDNYSAHKHDKIRTENGWRANPRVVVHFTPTHASWMNLVPVNRPSEATRRAV